jgi:hypothetical protein
MRGCFGELGGVERGTPRGVRSVKPRWRVKPRTPSVHNTAAKRFTPTPSALITPTGRFTPAESAPRREVTPRRTKHPGSRNTPRGWRTLADTTGCRSETPRMCGSPRRVADPGVPKHSSGRLHTGNVNHSAGAKRPGKMRKTPRRCEAPRENA